MRSFIANTAVINHVQLHNYSILLCFFSIQNAAFFHVAICTFSKITMISADQHFGVDSNPVLLLAGIGDPKDQQSEYLLISRMLSNHTIDFLWNTGSDWPGWPAQDNKTTVFNRYCRAGFTSKV